MAVVRQIDLFEADEVIQIRGSTGSESEDIVLWEGTGRELEAGVRASRSGVMVAITRPDGGVLARVTARFWEYDGPTFTFPGRVTISSA